MIAVGINVAMCGLTLWVWLESGTTFSLVAAVVCGLLAIACAVSTVEREAPAPSPPVFPEYVYVDLPDGRVIRGKTTPDPVWGFPTTPPLSEWEVVES